jgi:hypothetical protein
MRRSKSHRGRVALDEIGHRLGEAAGPGVLGRIRLAHGGQVPGLKSLVEPCTGATSSDGKYKAKPGWSAAARFPQCRSHVAYPARGEPAGRGRGAGAERRSATACSTTSTWRLGAALLLFNLALLALLGNACGAVPVWIGRRGRLLAAGQRCCCRSLALADSSTKGGWQRLMRAGLLGGLAAAFMLSYLPCASAPCHRRSPKRDCSR